MATVLGIFNSALYELGVRELASLTEPVESRRVLERLWDAGLPEQCLEQGAWNFAIRSVKSTEDNAPPAFGFDYRHTKPADWLRTVKISANEGFKPPLDHYSDEGGSWYSNHATMYIQYVSSHPSFGGNMARWPESFTRYVVLKLASLAAPRLKTLSESTSLLNGELGLWRRTDHSLKDAKSQDAINQPPEFPPVGTWVRSRWADNFALLPWDKL